MRDGGKRDGDGRVSEREGECDGERDRGERDRGEREGEAAEGGGRGVVGW